MKKIIINEITKKYDVLLDVDYLIELVNDNYCESEIFDETMIDVRQQLEEIADKNLKKIVKNYFEGESRIEIESEEAHFYLIDIGDKATTSFDLSVSLEDKDIVKIYSELLEAMLIETSTNFSNLYFISTELLKEGKLDDFFEDYKEVYDLGIMVDNGVLDEGELVNEVIKIIEKEVRDEYEKIILDYTM